MLKIHVLVLLMGLAVLLAWSAPALSRSIAVFQNGRTMSGFAAAAFSCEDSDLAFIYTETINGQAPTIPVTLDLDESAQETGTVTVQVAINQSCGNGQISFEYRHETGTADGDITIEPTQFTLTLPSQTNAQAARTVNYAAVDDNVTEDREAVTLIGDSISFFINDTAGGASRQQELAQIAVPVNREGPVDPEDLLGGGTDDQLNSVGSLNNACQLAADGSSLGQLCQTISVALAGLGEGERQQRAQQIAEELDPEITALTFTSPVAVSRTQYSNLLDSVVTRL